MNMRTPSLLSVAVLALLTTSCLNDPVKPEVITECLTCLGGPVAFEAVSANDRQLPTYINADGSTGAGRQLTRGSVVIVSPDSLRLVLTTRQVAENGEAGAAVSDTLWAHIRWQDSTVVISRMGTHPLLLAERATIGSDSSLQLTVEQPLPSSDGADGTAPVALDFRRTEFTGPDEH
jgi:hypothetical protein